ncbi:hypothetical protein GCM10011487_54990 [Steroidobacter agaridevorans]|uniref:Uncharacterized protein n=1 Tax=Steroidobacter agaridevorans TaxID=2695856 RepID=A0A829YJX8_9GAMM|nr:hypothetical protein GCM10011487_54990 [Steroidobacter agaridevorans]
MHPVYRANLAIEQRREGIETGYGIDRNLPVRLKALDPQHRRALSGLYRTKLTIQPGLVGAPVEDDGLTVQRTCSAQTEVAMLEQERERHGTFQDTFHESL